MTHIAYIPLLGDVKAIKIIVLWSAISTSLLFALELPSMSAGLARETSNSLLVPWRQLS